jgi:hypothetical protein
MNVESGSGIGWPDRSRARRLLSSRLLVEVCLCAAGTIQAYGMDVAHSHGTLLPTMSMIFAMVAMAASIGILVMTPDRGWWKGQARAWPRELRALVQAAELPERPTILAILGLTAVILAVLISDQVIFTLAW